MSSRSAQIVILVLSLVLLALVIVRPVFVGDYDVLASVKGWVRSTFGLTLHSRGPFWSFRQAPQCSDAPHSVGERGPELFIRRRSGRVMANRELATAGRATRSGLALPCPTWIKRPFASARFILDRN